MQYSLKEYALYISLQLISKIALLLPLGVALSAGKFCGRLAFYFDKKHKDVAYKNLRLALAGEKTIPELKKILKKNFESLGMNLAEILRITAISRDYVNSYIDLAGKENLEGALKTGRGAIILGLHMGNWELSFAVAGILGYPLHVLVEEQLKNPLLDKLLNQMRQAKGVKFLKVGVQLRELIAVLKEGKMLGLVADHGIREGARVEFFGHQTLTPTLAIRLALKLDVPILPVYIIRSNHQRHRLQIFPALRLEKSQDTESDIMVNLRAVNRIMENFIREYPHEYLWFYKRFKYNSDRHVLVLADAKIGHLRQIEACLKLMQESAREKGLELKIRHIRLDFKNKWSGFLQSLSVALAKKSSCRGCLWCLRQFLKEQSFLALESCFADIVISCGSALAGINFVVSAENQARSIVIMRPGILSTKRFDLVIMPRHDFPPKRKNTIITDGALNIIDEDYLQRKRQELFSLLPIEGRLVLGLLLGGDTADFHFNLAALKELIRELKSFLKNRGGEILVTTSRRTPPAVEQLVKAEFTTYPRCRFLVIANEKNIPDAVAMILGASQYVVVSPESISMISEAASSGRYVLVFLAPGKLGKRHQRFLHLLAENKYIRLVETKKINMTLEELAATRPFVPRLNDNLKIKQALEKLL